LRGAGFEITAVHNHLAEETPHVMYMHYMGHGNASQLAGLTANRTHNVEDSNGEARCAEEAAECTGLGGNQCRRNWREKARSRAAFWRMACRARKDRCSMNGMTIPPALAWGNRQFSSGGW